MYGKKKQMIRTVEKIVQSNVTYGVCIKMSMICAKNEWI